MIACLVLWTTAARAQAEDDRTTYPIVLFRPAVKGSRYRMTAEAHTTRKAVARQGDQETTRTESYRLEVETNVTVERVNPRGLVTESRYGILKCTLSRDGKTRELIPKGRVLHVTALGHRVVMRLGNKPLDEDVAALLEPLVSPGANRVTDDEVLGSKLPRRLGQRWPINSQRAAADLKKVNPDVTVKDVTGTVTLKGLETVGEVPCLVIEAHLEVDKITPRVDVPRGLEVKSSTMTADMSGAFPLDGTTGRLRQAKDSVFRVVARGKPRYDADEVDLVLTQRIRTVTTRRYLEPKED